MVVFSPSRMLVVLLGASHFPKAPKLASGRAFHDSAADLRDYVTEAQGLGVPEQNVEWLIDDSRAAADQLDDIASFLVSRGQELQKEGSPVQDLLLYYVGHGLFARGGQTYCLAVRSTNENNEGASSIRAADLASVLRDSATLLRRYLILDCCFSAVFYKELQSGPLQTAHKKLQEELPARGTTILCSSSARDASLAPQKLGRTMFSDALLRVLREGHPSFGDRLSISELGDAVAARLRNEYPDPVRPEVHSPDQREGDIAHIPIFPNPAYKVLAKRPPAGIEEAKLDAAEAVNTAVARLVSPRPSENQRITFLTPRIREAKTVQPGSIAEKAPTDQIAPPKAEIEETVKKQKEQQGGKHLEPLKNEVADNHELPIQLLPTEASRRNSARLAKWALAVAGVISTAGMSWYFATRPTSSPSQQVESMAGDKSNVSDGERKAPESSVPTENSFPSNPSPQADGIAGVKPSNNDDQKPSTSSIRHPKTVAVPTTPSSKLIPENAILVGEISFFKERSKSWKPSDSKPSESWELSDSHKAILDVAADHMKTDPNGRIVVLCEDFQSDDRPIVNYLEIQKDIPKSRIDKKYISIFKPKDKDIELAHLGYFRTVKIYWVPSS